jgi:hypothetical protein
VNVCDVQMMPNRTSVGEKQVNVSPTKCGVFWQVWKLVMRGKAEAVASNNKLKGDEESRVSFQMLVGGLRESNRLSSGFFFGSRHGNFFYCASTKRKRLGCRRQGFAVRLRSLFDDRRGRVRARVRGRKVNVFQFSLPSLWMMDGGDRRDRAVGRSKSCRDGPPQKGLGKVQVLQERRE